MVRVALVAENWSKIVEVDAADDVIEADGLSWELRVLHHEDDPAPLAAPSIPRDVPLYVPAVGA